MEAGDNVLNHSLIVEGVIDEESGFQESFNALLFVFKRNESSIEFRFGKRNENRIGDSNKRTRSRCFLVKCVFSYRFIDINPAMLTSILTQQCSHAILCNELILASLCEQRDFLYNLVFLAFRVQYYLA